MEKVKLIRNRRWSGSPRGSEKQHGQSQEGVGPLTNTVRNIIDTEIDRIIEDAKKANKELHIKDTNGKVTQNFNEREEDMENNLETSELDFELAEVQAQK